MTSANFDRSDLDFSDEQSLVNNFLEPNNIVNNPSLLTSEIIFVDETVQDYQQLVAEIDADVYRLDSNIDGIEQITEVLSQYEDISGVHLISHGDEGSLKLGATELNQENLSEYGDRLKLWNNSLLDDADFLIYGCDVAEGEAGEDFVKDLSSLIGADIAASNDLTGSKDLGGDWDLEYSTGNIEAETIARDDYQDVLATASLESGILIYDSDTSSEADNSLNLYISNDELFIQESNSEAITADSNLTQVDSNTVKVDLSSVTGISVQTNGGQDSITLDSSFSGFTGSLNLDAGSVTDGDSVTINSDLYTAGGDLSIQAESITIPQNTTISTRQISGTDHLNDASTGNSGAIDLDARTLTLDGTNLYAHVLDGDTTNTAGNIDLHVKEEAISTVFGGFDTFDVDVSVDPVDINVDIGFDSVDESIATIDLIGANLLGADITLDAHASYDEDSFVSTIDNYSLFIGAAVVEATATVNIDANSTINASSLDASAITNTDAIATPLSIGLDIGLAYGSIDADAQVIIDGDVTVDNDLALTTTSDNTIDVEADVGGYQNSAGAVAISEVDTTSKAQIGTTANISAGGNLSINANTVDRNYTLGRSTTGEDGTVGIGASISIENGSTDALLDSTNVLVAGDILLDAEQTIESVPKYAGYYSAGGVAAFAGVNTDSTGDLVSDTQFGITGSILSGIKNIFTSKSSSASSQTDGASSSFDLGAAMAYAEDVNNVTARIGDGAVVKSTDGEINIYANANSRLNVSAGSSIDEPTSSGDGTTDNSKFAGSAAVAIGNHSNNTYAYIGNNAVVDAKQAIDIKAESLNDYETAWGTNLVEPFTDDSLSLSEKFATFGSNFAGYLNDNLGLDNYVFDSWSQAIAGGSDIGIAGAVTLLELNQISEAYIGDNAQINQDDSLRSDNQTVSVQAINVNEAVHLGGNVQVPLGITGNFNTFLTIPDVNRDVWGTNNESGVGGTVLVVNYDNDVTAKIGDGVKLYADSLRVDADNTAMSISVAASGGEADKFGLNGTGTWFFVENDTTAQIHSGAEIEVGDNAVADTVDPDEYESDVEEVIPDSNAALIVDATDNSLVINVSGGVIISENIGIGASVGLNTIDRNTQAFIGTLDDETAPTTKNKVIVDGDVDINAENSGYLGSFALAAAISTEETYEQPESTDDYGSASSEDASWGIGISGEAGINTITDTTKAYISDIDIESSDTANIQPDIDIAATNNSEIITVGGSVAIALSDSDSSASAGIAGSFGKNAIDNATEAYVDNSVVKAGNLDLLADNNVNIISVNASGAGDFNDKGYALAGSVAINEINNDTLAYINDGDITVTTVDIDADDNSNIVAVAGSLAYGGRGGIGASVAINTIGNLEDTDNNRIEAYVSNSNIDVQNLDVKAKNDGDITSVAVSVGLAKDSMAGSFSVTYNRIKNDTKAYLLNSGTETVNVSGDINILAEDNSEIYSHAYPLSASFNGSAVGISLAINEITNNTVAYVDNATVTTENLNVEALAARTVQSIGVGGAIANSYGISGSISVVEIGTEDTDNQTTAYIGSSAIVTANNNVVISAEDDSEIFSLAGNVSFGTSGAIGVANSTLSTHNKVKAYVAGGADVTARGLTSDTLIHTGTVGGDFDPESENKRGLAVTAVSTRDLQAYAVSGAITTGSLAVAASLSLTLLDEETEAYIGSGAAVNSDNSSASSNQGVYVRAGSHTKLIGAGGGISGSSSAGIGAGGDASVLSHTTNAYIGAGAVVNGEQEVGVTAYGSQDIQSYAASGSFGGTLGVSGSAAYIGIDNATHAYIENSNSNGDRAIVNSQGNILVYAEDVTDADPFAGNLAFGGQAGIGGSVGIIDLDKDTQAYIGNHAEVNALGNSSATLDVYDSTDSNYTTTSGFKGLAVNAFSLEDIDTIAVGGSAAGKFGFAGSLTYSEIDSDTLAYTGSSTSINQATGANSSQDVNITAVNDLDTYALDGAIALAGVASIAGAVDIANIRNGTEAFIGAGSLVAAEDDIKVNALGDKTLESLVVSGSGSGVAALGGSVTVYNIGGTFSSSYEADGEISDALEQDGSTAQDSLQDAVDSLGVSSTLFNETALSGTDITTAYIGTGATVNAGGDIEVNAKENLDLDAFLGQASLAGTVAIGGSVGIVYLGNTTQASISSNAAISSNDLTVNAKYLNDTDVTSLAGTLSGTASIGGAVAIVTDDSNTNAFSLGTINSVNNLTIDADSDRNLNVITGNASASLTSAAGASVGVVTVGGETNAYLGGTVVNAGTVNVLANNQETIDIYTLAISGGVTSDSSGSVANGTTDSKTNAYIAGSADVGTTGTVGTVNVNATYTPEVITFAEGYGGSVGLNVGVSDAYGIIESDTKAYIGNNAKIAANNFNLTAEQQLPTSGFAVEADATASGGALVSSTSAATATAIDKGSVNTNLNSGVDLNVTDTLALTATLISDRDAFADGYNGGILALGFNFAFAESETENKLNLASGVKVNADTLNISVNGTENNYAEAISGGGGIVSGRAAEAHTDSISDTELNINSQIEVNTLDIQAEHTATFNSQVDSSNGSVWGGSGAYNENTVDADIAVNFNSNADITADDDFDVAVNNNIEQEELNDANAEAGSGGFADGSAVETVTTINNTSAINVNDGAALAVGDDDYDTIDNLDFAVVNDVKATAKSKLNSGGAISTAKAEAKVTNNTNDALINIGDADITSTHNINFSTRAIADLEADAKASAWGISGVSQGDSLAEAAIDNQINLNDGASVAAEQDINFYVGEDSNGNANDINVEASTNLWNNSLSPMSKDNIDTDGNLTLNNTIDIADGAALESNENINLVANNEDSTYNVTAEGEGTDAYSQVASALSSLVGAEVSSVITDGSTSESFTNGINVDGSVVAGQNNQQHLTITESGGSYSYDKSDQIETNPTITTEDVTASIDATISALETERNQYENSDDPGEGALYITLSAEIEFWENEKAKIGDGDVTVINLPNISASVGSISLAGGYLSGTGNIEARGDAAIDITNNTDAYLRVNDVSISDNYGGELLFNNVAVTSNDDLNSGSFNSIITGSDLGEPEINILNDSDSILEVKGSLTNRNGAIAITNTSGSIYVTEGEISAKNISIDAGESFFLSDGYLFTVDSSPEALWNEEVNDFIEESEDDLVYDNGNGAIEYQTKTSEFGDNIREDAESNQSTIDSRLSEAENPDGGVNAESSVFIASEYINVSGNISSGVSDYNLTIDSSVNSTISGFESAYNASSNPSSIDFSSEYDLTNYLSDASGNNISGYYDPTTNNIVIDDLEIQGGYIQLVGNILSTGNGNIEVMDGFGNISIDNNSNYDLQLNELDTGGEGAEGKIIIIDNGSGSPVTTTYTKDDSGIVKTVDGVEATSDTDIYTPKETHPYNWFYQNEQTLTLDPVEVPGSENAIPDDYQIYGDSLYFLLDNNLWWEQAQTQAESYGGNLVTINDAAENTWIHDTFSTEGNQIWIGLTDDEANGGSEAGTSKTSSGWVWQNGDSFSYNNWRSDEPNNHSNEDFGVMYDNGEWNDRDPDAESHIYGLVEIPLDSIEFAIESIEATSSTQNPQVYVYETPSYSNASNWLEAIAITVVNGLYNFTSPLDYPSHRAILFNQGDREIDGNTITVDVGSHYVNAVPHQYDIDINFFGHDSATVDVTSNNNIELTGDITNLGGDVNLTSSAGSVTANSGAEIAANDLTINAPNGAIGDSDNAINTNLDGGTLNATATGDIYIDETTGDIAVDTVSSSGNVNLEAYGNLEADSSSAKVTGAEINLTSDTGNIGSASLDVNIDSGSDDTAGVTLDAAGDIRVTETAGDLYLVSADANDGDVSISVTSGNLIDHNPEETEDLAARANLLDTVWSDMELTDEDISTTATDETGAASALAAETVTAYEQSKESEYQLYWQYRNLTQVTDDDGNLTGYTYDEYDADYTYSFNDASRTNLEELGYSDSAITQLEETKTEEYHTTHAELDALGLTDSYDENYTYTASTEEIAELNAGAVWTVDELTRVVNPGLLLPVSDTEINIEADNIQAANLNLNVGGEIGVNEGSINITVRDNEGNILGISDENLLYLLSAENKDVTYLDNAGNEVVDVSLNVDSVYSIAIAQIDDLDFEATGELDVAATANAYLGSEGDITINDLDVGTNEIRLKSGKGIAGTTTSSTHITADNIVVEAGDNSIGSDTTPIEIETNTITARGNNDIYINQALGDLDIEQIYSGDKVDLTVVGKVSDANDTDDENIRSGEIDIDSTSDLFAGLDSSLGSSDNYLDVYVESGGTYQLDTNQDAYILNTNSTGTIEVNFTGTSGTLSYNNGIYTITSEDALGTTNSVNFAGFDAIDLTLVNELPFGSSTASFVVDSLTSETTLNIVAEDNEDRIELSNTLEGTVTIDGGTGTNTLVLNDADDTAANSFNISEIEITGHITETITYSNIDAIEVQGGSNGNDALTVTNETDTTRTITADNSAIVDSSFPDITHSGIETIDYHAESGNNSLDATSFTDTGISLTVYSNLGDNTNTLDIDAPSDLANIVVAVDENATTLKVAALNHSSNSFTLSGTDGDKFEVLNDNELHFISAPDFETQSNYELTVVADGTDNIDLNISITDINEAPSLTLANSNLTLAEDTDITSGIEIGDINISDDALGDNVLSLSGDDTDLFELVNDTELYLVAGTELDFETDPDLDVTVTAEDGTFSVDLDLTVNVTDINEIASVDFDYVSVDENQVLVLDGEGDYVETNRDVIDLTSTDFTLEAWIQTSEINQGIIGKDDGDGNWENGEKAFYVNDAGKIVFAGNGNGSVVGNTAVNDGTWHHVMVVWDATNSQGNIYVDGIPDTASDNYAATIADNTDDTLKLGLTLGDDYFSGKLDKIIIWDKALTYEEIQDNLATTLTGREDNIVAYYNFENDSDTDVIDISGVNYENSYYGTIQGDAYKESDRTILTIAENTDTTSRVKIADITISDDALGTNSLTLSGSDSGLFELEGTELYISAGVTLDYETNPILDVTVEADDDTLGSTPDNIVNLRIVISDSNDAPTIAAEVTESSFPEDTDTTNRIKVADITVRDDAFSNNTLNLSGDDADLFEIVNDTELYISAGVTLDYETNPDLNVIVEVDDPTIGDSFDDSVGMSIAVTNVNEIFTLDYNDTNQSLALDGDGDYADTGTEVIDLSQANFTLEAWIKTSGTEQTIISKNDGDSSFEQTERVLYLDSDGKLEFNGYYNGKIEGSTVVNDGEWHHVAVVWDYDAGTGYIYVDGVDDTVSDSYNSGQADGDGHTLRIGFPRSKSQYFSGEMDEVRIWDKALSASDISSNFTRTTNFTGEEDNLVAYYTFQTGLINNTTVPDKSNSDYDLTLVDGARIAIARDLSIDNDNSVILFTENSADTSTLKIADITIIDNNYTTNDLIITGDDGDKVSISGTELLINSGTTLDFETDAELDFTIAFDSETVEAEEETAVQAIDILELVNRVTEIDENTDTSSRIKVADLELGETALSTNSITLSGDDADSFEVVDFGLYLKADTTIDYETQATYNVTVAIEDVAGSTVDASVDFSLAVNDFNEAPSSLDLTTNSTNFTDNLFLSGNENYLETNAAVIDFSDDFTLEAWIQTTEDRQGIITKSNEDSSWGVNEKSFLISSGKLVFSVNQDISIIGNTPVNDGKLHHVALVRDSANDEVNFYIDGVLDASHNWRSLPGDNNSHTVKVGSPNYSLGNSYFDGLLGEVRIWDVARTQEEISDNLSTTLTGTETGLVANYNDFNSDRTNTTIADNTGSYDGTVVGYDATLTEIALPENINTTSSIKLADYNIADEDATDTNQVTLTGNDSDQFTLVATGDKAYELHLAAGVNLDRETASQLNVSIEVSDSDLDDEPIITQSFTVVVTDENEAPTLTVEEGTITDLDEDTVTDERIQIAEVKIVDEDDNDNLNLLSLSGDDADSFELEDTKLYLKAGTTLDYEIKTQYDVTVELDDPTYGTDLEGSVDFNLAINNINDAPQLDVTVNSSVTEDILAFDGDSDYVEIDTDGINLGVFGEDATFETWIKTTNSNLGIFVRGNGTGQIDEYESTLYIHSSGQVRFLADSPSRVYDLTGETAINDGKWHHVALTLKDDFAYIYVDGQEEASDRYYLGNYATTEEQTFRLGSSTGNISSTSAIYFDGEMRDVRFWNTARTQLEIQGNLNSQLTGTETDLVAHYNFTDDSDTTAIDQSGNGKDGTIVNDISKAETIIFYEDTDTSSRIKIADFSVSDEDTNSITSASLGGADRDLFEIDGTEIYLKAGTIFDYDRPEKIDLTVELEDGNYSDSFTFDIGFIPVNDPPSLTLESVETSLAESTDTSSAIKVADLVISDDSPAYEITLTGDDGDKFEVVDVSDRDFFDLGLDIDYESETPNFSVTTIDTSLLENSSSAIKLADLAISDGAGITGFTLSGDDADSFVILNDSELYLQGDATLEADTSLEVTIEASDGVATSETAFLSLSVTGVAIDSRELYLKANTTLDYESDTSFDTTVEISDGEYNESATYSLAITNINEAPIFSLDNRVGSIDENTNTTGGIKVADLNISDDDIIANEITITGDDAASFEIRNDSELYLIEGTTLDYESKTNFNITVTVSDITHSTAEDYTLRVNNLIETELTISLENFVDELDYGTTDTTNRIKIADIVVTGEEEYDTFTLTGVLPEHFEIEGTELYLKAGVDLYDFAEANEGFINLKLGIEGAEGTTSFTIEVTNVVERPISILTIEYDMGYETLFSGEDTFTFPETVSVVSGSTDYEFELYNFGSASLEIDSITITGDNAEDFAITSNIPTSVPSGETGYITVEFDPNSGGEATAELEVISNSHSNSTYTFILSGTGIGSEINLAQDTTQFSNGDSQDFGILAIDTETSEKTFTITNTGTEALSISDVAITGDNADEFTITSAPSTEIATNESTTITVNFNPNGGGDRTATLTITNNDDDEGAFAINLTGNGATPDINLAQGDTDLPSGTTQDFGSVNVDNGKIQQIITIQNTGSDTLNLGELAVMGTNASYFILENSSAIANTQLEPGDSTDLTITFNPRTAETATATLTINSDDSDESAYTIDLTGTGTESTEVEGSDNNDAIENDDNNQIVDAGGGNDTVTGNDNGERVTGGDGADQVYGEDGNDRTYGDGGDDVLVGGDGRDFLRGGANNDLMFGGNDNDYLIGDAGEDYLDGESGSDRLRGGDDTDIFVLRSGDGTDLILDFDVDVDHFELDSLEVSDLTFEDDGFGLIKYGNETLAQVRNVTASQLEDYFTNKYSS